MPCLHWLKSFGKVKEKDRMVVEHSVLITNLCTGQDTEFKKLNPKGRTRLCVSLTWTVVVLKARDAAPSDRVGPASNKDSIDQENAPSY